MASLLSFLAFRQTRRSALISAERDSRRKPQEVAAEPTASVDTDFLGLNEDTGVIPTGGMTIDEHVETMKRWTRSGEFDVYCGKCRNDHKQKDPCEEITKRIEDCACDRPCGICCCRSSWA
jgi:hypothetical protein